MKDGNGNFFAYPSNLDKIREAENPETNYYSH